MRLIKEIKTEIIPCIFNQSLNTGIFPEKLNIAKVIPIHKKGYLNDVSNYRPISLLPSISKILEKLIFKQLSTYLNEHKVLYASQYGFRAGHSTELASIELIDRITQDLDKGKIPISIFLDLSKAFDTLDHVILLQKLNYYGITSVELKLFQDYFKKEPNMFLMIKLILICIVYPLVCLRGLYWALFYLSYILLIYATAVNCLR